MTCSMLESSVITPYGCGNADGSTRFRASRTERDDPAPRADLVHLRVHLGQARAQWRVGEQFQPGVANGLGRAHLRDGGT